MNLLLLALVPLAIVAGLVVLYNRLVAMRRLTENAWSDVDVYLKRRAELVPNLVEAVKGAAAYERGTFERLASARSEALASRQPTHERAAAESAISTGVTRAVALAEQHPELRASENFLGLQRELSDVERLVASARQYYNACVRDYNTMVESFPSNLVANGFGFKPKEFFEVETIGERQAPGVSGL